MRKTYRYFVSYIAFLEKGRSYGYCEIHLNFPLDGLDAIKNVAEKIRGDDGFKSVTILYFKLLGNTGKTGHSPYPSAAAGALP